ncbi:pyridoxamine phosphate oxidase-like protein [Amniculicola lignicola CBS 123094]|uniref:Pyridoxamine phosphate oxidase-like protein n=1 Tax=Amniculicola lignicola CBS 123094 TaxID=1392246 RepID=A0A6A5WT72_9PLEO|nr:pyridoxamine phosphate oxidase-like protein [Amniculicola lignicola CBS 123094]
MATNPAPASRPESSSTLPDEVITCLQNARFLHLSTASNNVPHISLMNYTYLPSTPYSNSPTIIMTTPPSSRKTLNLQDNPLVSILVHDWVSHRPPTLSQPGRSPSPARPNPRSGSLAELLLGMNTASLGRISTTINGVAEFAPSGSEQETWYKTQHLANNTFGPSEDSYSSSPVETGLWGGLGRGQEEDSETREGDGGTKCYLEDEEVRVVVVKIKDGRIADWKGQVRDWAVGGEQRLTNGV